MIKKICYTILFMALPFVAYAGITSLGTGSSAGYEDSSHADIKRDAQGNLLSIGSMQYQESEAIHENTPSYAGFCYNQDNCQSPKRLSGRVSGQGNCYNECSCPSTYKSLPSVNHIGSGNFCQENNGEVKYVRYSCKDGYYASSGSSNNAKECSICPKDHACVNGVLGKCIPGMYQDSLGSTSCKPCLDGQC